MSFEDWHYRMAEQYAHSEILAFLMMTLGMNLLVGGLIVTIIVAGQLILFPFLTQQPLSQSSTLGFILTASGFLILSAGFILVIHYDRRKSWHLGEIEKSNKLKDRKIAIKRVNGMFEEWIEEKKKS